MSLCLMCLRPLIWCSEWDNADHMTSEAEQTSSHRNPARRCNVSAHSRCLRLMITAQNCWVKKASHTWVTPEEVTGWVMACLPFQTVALLGRENKFVIVTSCLVGFLLLFLFLCLSQFFLRLSSQLVGNGDFSHNPVKNSIAKWSYRHGRQRRDQRLGQRHHPSFRCVWLTREWDKEGGGS